MKILFIVHHLDPNNGWSRYTLDFITELQKNGAEILCLVNEVTDHPNIAQKKCLESSQKYIANIFLSWKTSRSVNDAIREFLPDIIHFPVEPYGTMIPFLERGKAKIVLGAHGTYSFLPLTAPVWYRFISKFVARLTYAKTDLNICDSEYTKQHFVRNLVQMNAWSLVQGKIAVLSGGIDLSGVPKQKQKIPSDTKEILCVGQVKSRKGMKESIDALALVRENFVYHIVGSFREKDPYIALLRKKIAEYGLEKKVILEGRVSDEELKKLYEKADLYLMLSINSGIHFEGYGLVYLEANARGIPCIGPNDSGVSDAIVDSKTGYLVNQFDPVSVAKVIEKVLRDHTIDSQDCIAWAEKNSSENKTRNLLDLYTKLVS